MLHFSSLLNTAAGAPMAGRFEVRDTNAAGTQRMGTRLYQLPGNGSNYAYNEWWPVANTGGADITSRVLTLCYSSSAGTSFLNASSVLPYWFTCYYVGLATDYTEAVAL